MRPRGKDTRRARIIMVSIFVLAIIAGLVYIAVTMSNEEDRIDTPNATIEKTINTNAYVFEVFRA